MRPGRRPSSLRSRALLLGLLAIGALGVAPQSRAIASEDAQLAVVVEDGLVSIDARDAPLHDVLRAIGEQAGFALSVEGEASRPVSLTVAEVPVSEGIRLLLRDVESSVLTRSAGGHLVEVRIRFLTDRAVAVPPTSTANLPDENRAADAGDDLEVTPYDWREDRLAYVRQAVNAPRPGALGELTTLLLDDEDAAIRGSAAAALGKLRSAEAGEALALALADRDRRVRRAASRAFGALGGEQAVEALGRVLLEERAPDVRRMAAYALSHMGDEAALDALETAHFDRDRTVRAIAAAAFSRAGD